MKDEGHDNEFGEFGKFCLNFLLFIQSYDIQPMNEKIIGEKVYNNLSTSFINFPQITL